MLANRIRTTLGGLSFDLVSAHLPILHEISDPYRSFTLTGTDACVAGAIEVRFAVAEIEPLAGERIFDLGTWWITAKGLERALVFQTHLMATPWFEARFRPDQPIIQLTCSPRLLRSAAGSPCVESQFRYPLDQVLAMYFFGESGLIVHAAGLVRDGKGVALAGISGAGKSTITRLASRWAGASLLSDDRVILRVAGDEVRIHGTPWPGEAGVADSRHAPARALLFLEKGTENAIRSTAPRETLARLLPAISVPWYDSVHRDASLRACDAIVRRMPAGVLTFRPELTALEPIEQLLSTL